MKTPIKLALVYGSTREGRFCDVVAGWARSQIEQRGEFVLDLIDPATLGLPPRHARVETAAVAALRERIGWAEAFLVVTPEYNHGYPAPLKFLIDSVGAQWRAKPVAFVSYGGISGGLRAVEQLRQVFAELHAVTVRDSVSFANAREHHDTTGQLPALDRATRAMQTLLARLHWWAETLRAGREVRRYDEEAA